MKAFLLTLSTCLAFTAMAQSGGRYLSAQFNPQVDPELKVYGNNFTVLPVVLRQSQVPVAADLKFRLFQPADDAAAIRPVVIIHHTGSYMPIPFNGGLTGSINDKAVTELAARFAAVGYVVVTPEYRAGWNTTAPDVDEQTATLLIASLRGGQDMHMMTRYLRKTIAEDGNPLRIDADRIMAIGLGTGGYNVCNSNFLDRVSEVNDLDKFIDSRDNLPYYKPELYGDPYGIETASINKGNWVSYKSGFALGVNLGGAMGDSTWIEGKDTEAPIIGMHSIGDANAPFGIGNILVPTTMNTVLQEAPGTRTIVGISNRNGNNDILRTTNDVLAAANDPITLKINRIKDTPFTTRDGFETTLATDNMFPWIVAPGEVFANEYNYADTSLLSAPVRGAIQAASLPFTFVQLVGGEGRSNRNFLNATGARTKMDTIMSFVLPRAYAALNLAQLVGVSDVNTIDVGLSVAPNPASGFTAVSVDADTEISELVLTNVTGQVVRRMRAAGNRIEIDLDGLAAGMHFLTVTTDRGVGARTLIVQ